MKFHLDINNYDACPQYNDWIDEQYASQSGTLTIFGFQPRPSRVLYSLSQDTYQAGFDDFHAQQQDELKQIVFEDYPSPIAYYFYRFENGYENELQRLHFLRDTWEALVDILHAIAVAECRFKNINLSDPIAFSHFLSDKVEQRLLNVERILLHATNQGIFLHTAQIVTSATLGKMRELNQSRNSFSHSAAQSELQAKTWISECYEDVIDVLDDLRGLAKIEIFRYLSQVDGNTPRCEVFKGHGFTRTIRTVSLTPQQALGSMQYFQQGQILAFIDGCLFSMRPLVYYREDTSGQATKLCMFRKTHGDTPNRCVEYEVVGEAVRYNENRTLFQSEIDDLRGLFGLGPE